METVQTVKLSEITNPEFIIEMPDGAKRSFDPFDLFEKMVEAWNSSAIGVEKGDAIRVVLGYLPQKNAAELSPPAFTPSWYQCMVIFDKLKDFIDGLAVIKKLYGPVQS